MRTFSVLASFLMGLLGLTFLAPDSFAGAPTLLAPGLTHQEFSCEMNGNQVDFEELRMQPGKGLELRAAWNPQAVQNPNCRSSYGGPDLAALLKSPDAPKAFQTLAGVNGTLFRVSNRKNSQGKMIAGYISNHLLWSRGAGLIAPVRKPGGVHLFVADAKGGHDFRLSFVQCGANTCTQVHDPENRAALARPLSTEALIEALKSTHPSMTLAVQSNMPLLTSNSYQCPMSAEGKPTNDWRCARAARTLLCGRKDGSVSLITTSGAYPADLVSGLREGGACQTNCSQLYNLDGGGSTQMGYFKDRALTMSGSRMDTTQPGCSPYRPVDNYLLFGKPR